MGGSIFIPIISVLVVVAVAFTFFYIYIYSINREMADLWGIILEKMHRRLDKIPAFIERTTGELAGQEELFSGLISERAKSWELDYPDKQKIKLELNISAKLNTLWGLCEKNNKLMKDVRLLSLRKEFADIGKEIEELTEVYNHKARRLQKGFFLMMQPVQKLMGFKKFAIFEFEP